MKEYRTNRRRESTASERPNHWRSLLTWAGRFADAAVLVNVFYDLENESQAWLAVAVRGAAGSQLAMRFLDQSNAKVLASTEGALGPFIRPAVSGSGSSATER